MGLLVIVVLAAALFATGTPQARQVQPPGAHEVTPHGAPDMSGTWMLIDAADRPAAAAHELTVTQDSTSFAVAASGGTIPGARTSAIGRLSGLVSANGDRTEQSTTVMGKSLVIETAVYPAGRAPTDESTWWAETWSIAGDRLSVHVQERRADRTVLDATLVYRRQQ